jgi:hypothetical protein
MRGRFRWSPTMADNKPVVKFRPIGVGSIFVECDVLRDVLGSTIRRIDPTLVDRETEALVERALVNIIWKQKQFEDEHRG